MTNIEIVPASLAHVQALGRTMNDEDRIEALSVGLIPHRVLWKSWKKSMMRYAAIVDGDCAAIWGVEGSLLGGQGRVWLVTGRRAREVPVRDFIKIYRSEVRKMLDFFDVLWNYVDDRYLGAKRMLKIAGFKLDEPKPLTKFRRMFRRFYKEAS